MRRLLAIIFSSLIVILFVALSTTHRPIPPTSLVGVWHSTTNHGDMLAKIDDHDITIMWEDPDMEALYWKGTLPNATEMSNDTSVVSVGDRAAMEQSFLASTVSTKVFKYKDKTLSCKLTIMGVTSTVYFKR